MNMLVFISDAVRKMPSFSNIHNAQRKKEITAWTNIIAVAKKQGKYNRTFRACNETKNAGRNWFVGEVLRKTLYFGIFSIKIKQLQIAEKNFVPLR